MDGRIDWSIEVRIGPRVERIGDCLTITDFEGSPAELRLAAHQMLLAQIKEAMLPAEKAA